MRAECECTLCKHVRVNKKFLRGHAFLAPFHTVNCTTFENARIQLPSSGSIGMTASTQTRDNERVWRAGELAGSGKVSFHTLTSLELSNSTLSKRCFRVRETHDLETRQHRFSAFVSSRRRSMMRSEISGGRRGLDSMMVAVLIKSLKGRWIVEAADLPCIPYPHEDANHPPNLPVLRSYVHVKLTTTCASRTYQAMLSKQPLPSTRPHQGGYKSRVFSDTS